MSKEIPYYREITDFETVPMLFHDKKSKILRLLLEKQMNIQAIAKATKMNPGTVRRHLDDLALKDLVVLVDIVKNDYNQNEKYYRATALKFRVNIEFEWPMQVVKKK
ncbi:MAG: winged helix-turn-helix transcriptional regulator [Candidatus Heimdallarchaeota archaeon]|nr:winged helix-turn-helix transcriptional regulator [Candidatus Heimdallarchaeota archaeon]